jgi:chromosome segregation ATPase
VDPFTLGEPWRRAVQDALQAQNRFAEAVSEARKGPLRDRMAEIGSRIDHGVDEAWRVARQGQSLVEARKRIDLVEAQQELREVEGRDDPASQKTAESLRAQMASADRLSSTIEEARARLRLTNARLDEAVARATELSVAADDVSQLEGLGDDVDALVTDLEALRLGLEEVQRPATG